LLGIHRGLRSGVCGAVGGGFGGRAVSGLGNRVPGRPATAREAARLFASRAARTEAAGWGEATIAQLRALWDEGHSASVIGLKLKKSKNSIVGKAHRLHLAARPSPIVRSTAVAHVKRASIPRRAPAVTLPRLPSLAPSLARSVPPPVVVAPPAPPPARLASGEPCCWPVAKGRYCDAPSVARKPYCPEHCAKAYPAWRLTQAAA